MEEEQPFVRLAAELGGCMAFEPRRWRRVLDESSQVLAANGARPKMTKRRPRSRSELDEEQPRLPRVEQYLGQPGVIDAILREQLEAEGEAIVVDCDTPTTNQSAGRRDERNQFGDYIQTAVTPPTTVKLPVLSTMSANTRRGISRLPSPTTDEMQQINMIEQMAEQERGIKEMYQALQRQNRIEKRAGAISQNDRRVPKQVRVLGATQTVQKTARSGVGASTTSKSPQHYRVTQTPLKTLLVNKPSRMHQADSNAKNYQVRGQGDEVSVDNSNQAGVDQASCLPSNQTLSVTPINSDVQGDKALLLLSRDQYQQLKDQHELSLQTTQMVEEKVGQTMAEVRRWLPLDVIYRFGLGKCASPAHQRATELIFRVGARLQYGFLSSAMNQWKTWLTETIKAEQRMCSVRLQCWWRRISAIQELITRRRIRQQIQQRQLQLLQQLASKEELAALRITHFFRLYCHFRRQERCEQERNAAITIQIFWRKASVAWLALRREIRGRRRSQAAIYIQSYTRGMIARRKHRLLLKIKNVSNQQLARRDIQLKRAAAIDRLGAAITIQRGFREWCYRRVLALRRRRAIFEKEKRVIVKLQTIFRGHKARQYVSQHRLAVAKAATTIQCWWRSVCARLVFHEKKLQRQQRRQRIRDEISNRRQSAFPNVQAVRQKWTKLAANMESSTVLKDGTRYSMTEVRATAKLQAFWRGCQTRKRVRYHKARETENNRRTQRRRLHRAATCIQKRFRGIEGRALAWRLKEGISAQRIQSYWRGFLIRRRLRETQCAVRAVGRLQARWRKRRGKERQRIIVRAVLGIQRVMRRFLGKRWLCAMVRRRQFLAEELEMGKRLMETTRDRTKDELLLQSFVFKKLVIQEEKGSTDSEIYLEDNRSARVDRSLYHVDLAKRAWKRRGYDGVWQELFRNASGGKLEIDNSHFARFLKQLPHAFIHKSQFPIQKADLCFAKMKEPKAKTISFSRFNSAIIMILREKFAGPADGKLQSKPNSAADAAGPSLTPAETAALVESDHANFVRFMKRYVLTSATQDGRYRKNLDGACNQRILWAVDVLRRFAARIESRKKHDHFMIIYRERQVIKHANQCASKIKKCFRRYKFRRELKAMLGSMFIEFIDYRGRSVRFTHIATRKSVEKRPFFLKGVACKKTIPLPYPGEEFRAFCERHEDSTRTDKIRAQVYCTECEDAMCLVCFERDHGKRHALQQHTIIPIRKCVHCEVETATRECLVCGNGKVPYCDCCFPHVHERPLTRQPPDSKRLPPPPGVPGDSMNGEQAETSTHRSRALVVMCIECSSRAAQWKCNVCADVYCKRCLISFHAKGMRQYHEFYRLSFYSVLCNQAEERRLVDLEKQREKKLRELAEAEKQRAAELAKQNASAILIQALVRSFLTRKHGKEYMKLVRQTQVARAQRHKDNKVRATVVYRVRSVFGLAPSLRSDTKQEVVAQQERLSAIKRVLVLEQLLQSNQSKGPESHRRKRWTKKQRARAEQAARTWCTYDGKVRINRGDWRNQVATIVSTQNLMLSGRVLVFIALAKRSVVVNWEWLEPHDDDEILRQPYISPQRVLVDLSQDFRAKLTRVVERTRRLTRLLYLQTIEFNDVVQYAWVVEFNKHEQKPEYWNVVLNKRTFNVPKAMQLIERMEPEQREKVDERVALAKQKLEALLHPFQPRDKPKVARRRGAIVQVQLRPRSRDGKSDDGSKMEELRKAMQAMDHARFWHDSVETSDKLSSSTRRAADKFAEVCSKPPNSSKLSWSLARLLQWMDLTDADGFESLAKKLFGLSLELQLFMVGEMVRALDEHDDDMKEAREALGQLLKLKEETLTLLLSKHEEAVEAEAAAS